MGAWVTQREAAELLGVTYSLVGKLVARGVLTPRADRPSLPLDQVVKLAAARAAAERDRRLAAPPVVGPQPPDGEYEWLLASAAAAVLGCTQVALQGRAARGQVPYVVHRNRRWFRLDLLELAVRAQVARERRQVSR